MRITAPDFEMRTVEVSDSTARVLRETTWERDDFVAGLARRMTARGLPPPMRLWRGLEHLATVLPNGRVFYGPDPDALEAQR